MGTELGVSSAPSVDTPTHSSHRMTFWQENYHFIKDVYDMRHQKMAEWMENVEKAIARIMADKVYTSAEFRGRETTSMLCAKTWREQKSRSGWLKSLKS